MATLAPVAANLVTTVLSVQVNAAPDSEGEQLPWNQPSAAVRLRLPLNSPSVYYRIDDGDWRIIDGASNRVIMAEIDLSVSRVLLRRKDAGAGPAALRVVIESYGSIVQAGVVGSQTSGEPAVKGDPGKSLLQGMGEPGQATGKPGDTYIDLNDGDVYIKE